MNKTWMKVAAAVGIVALSSGAYVIASGETQMKGDYPPFLVNAQEIAQRISDKLDLSLDQQHRVGMIVDDEQQITKPLVEKLMQSRKTIQALTAGGDVDGAKLQAASAETSQTIIALYVEGLKARSRVDEVLTPAQLDQANSMWDDAASRIREKIQENKPIPPQVYRIAARKLDLSQDQVGSIKAVVAREQPVLDGMLKQMLIDRDAVTSIAKVRPFDVSAVRARAEQSAPPLTKLIVEAASTRASLYKVLTEPQRAKVAELQSTLRQRGRQRFQFLTN